MNKPISEHPIQDEIIWDKLLVSGFTRIFRTITSIVSFLVLFASVGYLVGWVRAIAYFNEFEASWIVEHLSALQLLSLSAFPLAVLSFFILAQASDQFYKRGNWIAEIRLVYIFIFLGLISLTASFIFENEGLKFITKYLQMLIFLICSALLVSRITIEIQRNGRWSINNVWLLYVAMMLGLYFGPGALGKAEGIIDVEKATSRLPHVLINNQRNWRLLLPSSTMYFIIRLHEDGSTVIRAVRPTAVSFTTAAVPSKTK